MTTRFVLTVSCPDAHGIVHAVSGFLVEQDCNITESQQFREADTDRFFLRTGFERTEAIDIAELGERFRPLAERFGMRWHLSDAEVRPRALIMVSRVGHCLNDLLYRQSIGALRMDIAAIVSNHVDFATVVERAGVPFHHIPVTAATKDAAEQSLLELIAEQHVDVVVLARYMQILGERVCSALPGRIINIHHSLLPSFAGANPYQQAHDRGVKLVGATAHYVTATLDDGPIIEQDVARVDHADDTARLVAAGRDVEARVLARAVRWHLEDRVLVSGRRTIVFPG